MRTPEFEPQGFCWNPKSDSYKKDWAILLHLIYFYYLLPVTNYLIIKLSVTDNLVLADITLLKTTCHFPLLLVGFDTLTYRKGYDRSLTFVGHQASFLAPFPVSDVPLVD